MNLFEKATGWLDTMVKAAAGRTVTYTRGAESITLTAVVGQTSSVSNTEVAVMVQSGDRDYLIAVDDLTFGEPRSGDRIGESGLTFEVQEPGTGEPAWRYSDPERTQYRLHTKRVK